MKKITFLTCGGTIDKDYGVGKGIYDVEIGEPSINKIIKKFDINYNIEVLEVLKKDSLDMTDNDRLLVKKILDTIDNDRIIITHGTDIMIDTGKIIKDIKGKIIVLVGSSRPWAMNNSDAELNIGYAMGILDILSDNKMYGEYFNLDNVKKGYDGIFRKINK